MMQLPGSAASACAAVTACLPSAAHAARLHVLAAVRTVSHGMAQSGRPDMHRGLFCIVRKMSWSAPDETHEWLGASAQ